MMKTGFVRATLVAGGVFYLLSGLGLLLIPQWFYENIGNYPPFNRHYAGDVGAFLLPLGIALLWAARNPSAHASLIGYAAAGSLLHALNHLYDDLTAQVAPGNLAVSLPLLIFAIVLVAAYVVVLRPQTTPDA
jgi:hypothetical protein